MLAEEAVVASVIFFVVLWFECLVDGPSSLHIDPGRCTNRSAACWTFVYTAVLSALRLM